MPIEWGAHFTPWLDSMSSAYPGLENICLKRMLITNDDLTRITMSFPGLKELVLICCEGFGLARLADIDS
ncbi:Transport inhibitor response 1-like [Ranunculus cassubicifolius]